MLFALCLSVTPINLFGASAPEKPLRLGIVGLVHDHVNGFFRPALRDESVEIVGISESNRGLWKKHVERYDLPESIFHASLEDMLDKEKPEAVAVFSSTYDHAEIVEACAVRGIHVMMEKPLAVNMEHAVRIKNAAEQGKIKVIVNYETTWYPSNHFVADEVEQGHIGDIRKVVVHDGHQGPREIGCSEEFLAWLTDPVLNGGGALFDFGCYGANLMTWLMANHRPLAVTAVTQTIKPDIYPKVDDEATIIIEYPTAQCIIQASWNWPYNRKDMEVYGKTGYAHALNREKVKVKRSDEEERMETAYELDPPYNTSLNYFTAVVRGTIPPKDLSSLENNLIVTEILDAARRSAETGQKVYLRAK